MTDTQNTRYTPKRPHIGATCDLSPIRWLGVRDDESNEAEVDDWGSNNW